MNRDTWAQEAIGVSTATVRGSRLRNPSLKGSLLVFVFVLSAGLSSCIVLPKGDSQGAGINSCEDGYPLLSPEKRTILHIQLPLPSHPRSFSTYVNSFNREIFEGQIARHLLCSGRFNQVERGKIERGYYMEFTLERTFGHPPVYGTSMALSILTVGLIPGYETSRLVLSGELYKDGNFLRTFTAHRDLKYFLWVLFVFGPDSERSQISQSLKYVVDDINLQLREAFESGSLTPIP